MAARKSSKDRLLLWTAGLVAATAAGLLVWLGRSEAAPAPSDQPKFRPDGTFGSDTPLGAAQGPIFPAHGRILVVGGDLAAGLGYALADAMKQVELNQPNIPATPAMLTVWDGQGVDSVASFEAVAAKGIPDSAKNLGGLGPPDVIVVMVGEYDAKYGADGDVLGAGARLAAELSGIARDHLPNVIWVLPWSGPYADTLRVPLAAAVFKGAPLHVMPFSPDKKNIDMTNELYPSPLGYAALAQQVAAILLKWWYSNA